jgi:hypothetical protein
MPPTRGIFQEVFALTSVRTKKEKLTVINGNIYLEKDEMAVVAEN